MAVDTVMVDTAVDTHTVMANRNCFRLEYLVIFLNNPPLELSKPTLLPSAILLKLCFFYEKIVIKLIFGPKVVKNANFKKKGTFATSSVLLSGYDIQLPIRDCDTTVKLGNKEQFDKELIGIKEPFAVTNLPFTS